MKNGLVDTFTSISTNNSLGVDGHGEGDFTSLLVLLDGALSNVEEFSSLHHQLMESLLSVDIFAIIDGSINNLTNLVIGENTRDNALCNYTVTTVVNNGSEHSVQSINIHQVIESNSLQVVVSSTISNLVSTNVLVCVTVVESKTEEDVVIDVHV